MKLWRLMTFTIVFYTEQNNKNNLIATMDGHKQSMFFKSV